MEEGPCTVRCAFCECSFTSKSTSMYGKDGKYPRSPKKQAEYLYRDHLTRMHIEMANDMVENEDRYENNPFKNNLSKKQRKAIADYMHNTGNQHTTGNQHNTGNQHTTGNQLNTDNQINADLKTENEDLKTENADLKKELEDLKFLKEEVVPNLKRKNAELVEDNETLRCKFSKILDIL